MRATIIENDLFNADTTYLRVTLVRIKAWTLIALYTWFTETVLKECKSKTDYEHL